MVVVGMDIGVRRNILFISISFLPSSFSHWDLALSLEHRVKYLSISTAATLSHRGPEHGTSVLIYIFALSGLCSKI